MPHLVTFPGPDAHLSEGVGRSLPVGRHPRGPPPQFKVGADWRGVNVLQLFQLRKRLQHTTQRFPWTHSLAPEPKPVVCLRVITGKRDASAVAPNVWLLNCRHVEVKLTCPRLCVESPKPPLEGSGWCLLCVCLRCKFFLFLK